MKLTSELLSCTKYKTIKIRHKITKNIIPKYQEKQLVKLSLQRKQTIDEIFYNFSCLSPVNYGKNVSRLTDNIAKTSGFKIMCNSCWLVLLICFSA